MKRIFALFCLIICLIFTTTKAQAENIKFVQITDAHISTGSEYSQKVLKSAIADINSQPEIAFVVFTGDNINNPTEDNLRTFISIIKKLKVPYYIALGNHDVYKNKKMSKIRYFEILREGNPFYRQKTANYKFSKNGFLFLVVDGAKEVIPGSIGYYRKDTLNWVDQTLSKNEKQNAIIFQHFPVEYPDGVENKLKTHRTYKVEEYQNMLSKHDNVLAVLSGHFHTNGENMKDGVYHISTPSIINVPNSYKIIDIVTSKEFSPIIYTQLREFEVAE
jgi:3',5'-cyclic AMP phosphodiesterase CpdA